MFKDLETTLLKLPTPSVVEEKTFDELLAENIDALKVFLGDEYKPLESDPFMKKLRVLTLRQLHNQADKNKTIKQLLVTTATGDNLDHLGAGVGVLRDDGEYPYATVSFSLSSELDETVVIPSGTVLSSDDDKKSVLKDDVVIERGSLTALGKVFLQEYIKESDTKTENIITDLPFLLEVKQLENFSNGKEQESDDRYRYRIVLSYLAFNTTGAEDAYKYHTYSADSRIDDVVVLDEVLLEVHIYIASFLYEVDDVMIQRVYDNTASKDKRPLGDKVVVKPAKKVELDLEATIEVFDLLKSGEIEKKIRQNFTNSFLIGEDFVRSDFDKKCHVDGVYRVVSNFEDVVVDKKEIIKINSLKLDFKEVAR